MDISEKCQICKQTSDQMLMLACIHDPCINCAASAYAELVHIKNNDPQVNFCSNRLIYVRFVGKRQHWTLPPSQNSTIYQNLMSR